MRFALNIFGLKLELEIHGLRVAYIKTNYFEALWNRNEWFEGPNGEWRHWCFDRLKMAA